MAAANRSDLEPRAIRRDRWWDSIAAFLFPEVCQLCRQSRARPPDGYVCEHCTRRIRRVRAPFCDRCGLPFEGAIHTRFECANCKGLRLHFDGARAAVIADAMMLDLIHRYKYQGALWFEPLLGNLLVEALSRESRRRTWDWIVPVPLHPVKKRARGFNQAERLARWVAPRLGMRLEPAAIKRVAPTRSQTMLDRRARVANMARAFAPRPAVHLEGKHILLIDDVLTTGATTSACARVLKRGGARSVWVWTVARGL